MKTVLQLVQFLILPNEAANMKS